MIRTSVSITTIDRVPSQRDKKIVCRICGWSCPRWQKRLREDDPRRSGMLLLAAHELEVHGEDVIACQ